MEIWATVGGEGGEQKRKKTSCKKGTKKGQKTWERVKSDSILFMKTFIMKGF